MAEHPLGWVEHRLAWSPTGELGRWATAQSRDREDRRHIVRPRRASAPNMPNSRSTRSTGALPPRWRRATTARVDPQRSARAALVPRPRRTPIPTPQVRARHRRRRRPPLTQRAGARRGARRLRREAAGHRPHAEPQGHRDHATAAAWRASIPAISRYYGGPLSWLEIVGDHDDPAHGATHAMIRRGPMKSWFAALPLAFAVPAIALAKPPSPPLRCSRATPRSASRSRARFPRLPRNRSETPRPATMTVDGVSLSRSPSRRAESRARRATSATSRRSGSSLLRPPPPGSLFAGQKRLKLVTHCKRSADFQQKVAARIFRLPAVQSADAAELPRAARERRLCRRRRPAVYFARRFFPRGFRRRRQAQRHGGSASGFADRACSASSRSSGARFARLRTYDQQSRLVDARRTGGRRNAATTPG